MEELKDNECLLENANTEEVVCGTIEEDENEMISGGFVEKGIFWGGAGGGGTPVTFHNRFFNQKEIDPYSCFYVAHYTALANNYNVEIPLSVIKDGWADLVANGGFTPGRGGRASVGAKFAVKHFNKYTGKNVEAITIPFNAENFVKALKSGSNFVFWIKYGSGYSKNEQDDGQIQNTAGTIGENGHLVCGVKANTLDDHLMKFAEQYYGLLKHDIILVDVNKVPGLFQNTLTYFREAK